MQETQVRSLSLEDPWRRKWNPLQYACLEISMDRGAWWAQSMGHKRLGHDLATKQQQHRKKLSLVKLYYVLLNS